MKIPKITHLQWLVLSSLVDGQEAGVRIREELAEHNAAKSGPAFYQLMSRMESDGLVKGWYEYRMDDNQPIKERWYKLTAAGRKTWDETGAFYAGKFAALHGGLGNA